MTTEGSEAVVRVGVPADTEGVLQVQRRSPGRSYTRRFRHHIEQAIADPSSLLVVATADDELIAWAMTSYFDHADGSAPAGYYLMGITVVPEFRRRGVATKLVQVRLDWIRQRDRRAYFFTNTSNELSIRLHERVGFREIERGAQFRGVPFDGGQGVLFSIQLPEPSHTR
ncbi:GNAT family N-acetyltransferase [Microbacterium sp. SL62]|uniref:GNAT family N-acetyltransferase n=1 Tax=Microbacterium sp. SL62 TaxID=2995139 RepID=UPI0022742699|nr:GNAT family N-acetyltransferase [Microbacterium sp. SL62]MCY1718648.1 GNAT family N-acetyltransferase [Microbacterium sp. SL62]